MSFIIEEYRCFVHFVGIFTEKKLLMVDPKKTLNPISQGTTIVENSSRREIQREVFCL
jgi:hypothetical protein